LEIIKILCLGNNSEDTMIKAQLISNQYSVPMAELLTEQTDITSGCYYTGLGTISTDYLRQVAAQFDLIVLLDQPESSYDHNEAFTHTVITCMYLANLQPVVVQSNTPWLYIVKYFQPDNNGQVLKIKDNLELYHQVMTNSISNRNLVLQLNKVNETDFYNFTKIVNEIVARCRSLNSRFVMFRADRHESNQLHFDITKFLVQFPEFVLLHPAIFGKNLNENLTKIINQHWKHLYEQID